MWTFYPSCRNRDIADYLDKLFKELGLDYGMAEETMNRAYNGQYWIVDSPSMTGKKYERIASGWNHGDFHVDKVLEYIHKHSPRRKDSPNLECDLA